jgi:hypothetical protein
MAKVKRESRRATFLKEILEAFDAEDWTRAFDALNEASVATDLEWYLTFNELSRQDADVFRSFCQQHRMARGRIVAADRLSLQKLPDKALVEGFEECLSKLSTDGRHKLPDMLEMVELSVRDSLDAKFAREVVAKLAKIVERADRLQSLPTLRSPNRPVQLAFEEAHRCYLYGFGRACVVLCRATIEASLREALQRSGDSFDEKGLRELLRLPDSKRALAGCHRFAEEIRIAGNWAVHGNKEFEKRYTMVEIEQRLSQTRQVIEQLYGAIA